MAQVKLDKLRSQDNSRNRPTKSKTAPVAAIIMSFLLFSPLLGAVISWLFSGIVGCPSVSGGVTAGGISGSIEGDATGLSVGLMGELGVTVVG